jgi:hypothetical protein
VLNAWTAVARVAQPDLADVDLLRSELSAARRHWPEALAATAKALDEYGQRHRRRGQVVAALRAIEVHAQRARSEDLRAERELVATWKPVAEALHEPSLARTLAAADAMCRWFQGDTESAQRDLMALWRPKPLEGVPRRHIDGVVVAADGKPVTGATVIASPVLFFDSHGPIPFAGLAYSMRVATTDATGAFEISDAPVTGAIVAQLGAARSLALALAPHVRLALAPGRRITGTATLGGREATTAFVMVEPADGKLVPYRMIAPIAPDGTFALDGAPTGRLRIGVAAQDGTSIETLRMIELAAGAGATPGVRLALTSSDRVLDMIVRSTTQQQLDSAQVVLLAGHVTLHTVQELNERARLGAVEIQFAEPLVGEAAASALIGQLHAGDLVAHFGHVPTGDLTACAIGLNGDFRDPKFESRLQARIEQLVVKCEWLGPSETSVVVEAPPQKRFD